MKLDEFPNGDQWPHRSTLGKRCFYGFTRLEVFLILLCAVFASVLVCVCVLWLVVLQGYRHFLDGAVNGPRKFADFDGATNYGFDQSAVHHGGIVCTSMECASIAAYFAGNINQKVDPCADFYEFACGNYGLQRHLPANKPLRHTLSDMQATLNRQVRLLLESPVTEHDKPWDRLAKDYYQKCIQEDVIDKTGLSAMRKLLSETGGWPVLEGAQWKEWNSSWEKQLAVIMNQTGVNAVILELAVSHDPMNSSRSIIELDQPKWGVGSRWPYLTGQDDLMIRNYTSLMIKTAISLGADPRMAEAEMKSVIDLELRLVNYSADEMIRRDPDRSNNRFQLWQLRDMYPNIDLDEYIRTIFADIVDITDNDTVIVRETDYFKGIQNVMKSASKRDIANYFQWRVIQSYSLFLPPSMREPFYVFKASQTGMFNSPTPERFESSMYS
ncbi:hypothetical protein AB6A40_004295 [Gnathostoma spinigerum]|uniref:Peptidase M13 N-terminal domain-containing protein n=1 Tax=Gnathostoma spinigerum TaxID=75299 RepID=A0ABD6ED48_9BILA